MLRSLLYKQQNQIFRTIGQQRATLATCTRQIRGAQPSLIEADHDFTQTTTFNSECDYSCQKKFTKILINLKP